MASPFKIPKKKQPAGSDSAPLHTSPLSRLQSPAPEVKSYGGPSSRGGRVHAGSSASRQSAPLFRDVVKTLLGLNGPNRGAASANHRAAAPANHRAASSANHRAAPPANHRAALSRRSQPGQRAESSSDCFSNGWRPKRASDRLLQPAVTSHTVTSHTVTSHTVTSQTPSPPQKKRSSPSRSVSVESLDSLAELRGEEHAGRGEEHAGSSSAPGERAKRRRGSAERKVDTVSPEPLKQQKNSSGSDQTSEDDFVSPSRTRTPVMSAVPDRRRSLDRTAWLTAAAAGSSMMEEERKRRRRADVLQLRHRKHSEPIVLSSEEEEEAEDEAAPRTSHSRQQSAPGSSEQNQAQQASTGETGESDPPAPPSFLQLDFTSLHAGLTHATANGKMMVTESGITLPLKGVEEGEVSVEVSVVASEVRGYGVWDGGVAQGGTLLAGWEGPAPSLLFLWVTDAQANVLQRELLSIHTWSAAAGPSCSFLLLLLKEQLQELQAALLTSILDMEEYRRCCSSCSGPTSPLEWTDGLLLLHSCPPPLDQHLLRLLGHSAVRTNQRNQKSNLNSSGLQQLPTRLIQYPAAPSKGRISVTKEDLACLGAGAFLNDVIIDFYLKFLFLEGVGGPVAQRSHVFSSFFYKQLSRRRAAGEDGAASVPDRHTRHQRVRTWTRHVDVFTKDFLFVPVNQEAHWYLVVVCFPGLQEVQQQQFLSPTGGSERSSSFSLRSQQPPECSEQGWTGATVLQRPCILVMDSLKLSYHENVCRLIREYLQVEWEVRRGTPRLFTSDRVQTCSVRVPQQDNSSDCGLYLLQYAHSFLQNPVVNFDLPLRLDNWFLRQRVRQKREEIRGVILKMYQSQNK